jgi:hypothetical protein
MLKTPVSSVTSGRERVGMVSEEVLGLSVATSSGLIVLVKLPKEHAANTTKTTELTNIVVIFFLILTS